MKAYCAQTDSSELMPSVQYSKCKVNSNYVFNPPVALLRLCNFHDYSHKMPKCKDSKIFYLFSL